MTTFVEIHCVNLQIYLEANCWLEGMCTCYFDRTFRYFEENAIKLLRNLIVFFKNLLSDEKEMIDDR